MLAKPRCNFRGSAMSRASSDVAMPELDRPRSAELIARYARPIKIF